MSIHVFTELVTIRPAEAVANIVTKAKLSEASMGMSTLRASITLLARAVRSLTLASPLDPEEGLTALRF